MKKLILLIVLSALSLTACGNQSADNKELYIEQAALGEDEKELLALLDGENENKIFDFASDGTARSAWVNIFELHNEGWRILGQGKKIELDEGTGGRVSLKYDSLSDGVDTKILNEGKTAVGAVTEGKEDEADEELLPTDILLDGRQDFEYEKPIPIAIQIYDDEPIAEEIGTEAFYNTEELQGYQRVFAVTLTFSQEPVSKAKRYGNGGYKYLEEAELTDEERKILSLTGGSGYDIYNFYVDENIENIQINYYEYNDGEWKLLSGENDTIELSDSEGRLMFKYYGVDNGITYSVQTETDGVSWGYIRPDDDDDDLNKGTHQFTENPAKIINYGEDIFFYIRAICKDGEDLPDISAKNFYETEPLNEYEKAYAVAVRFNEKTGE